MSKKNIIVRILTFIISIIIGIGIGIGISSQNRLEVAELHRHATSDHHLSPHGVHNL